MAEDAYEGKRILIIDDINDSGATLNWIREDWEDFHPSKREPWKTIWGNTVRVATLVDNEASASELNVNYSAVGLNKAEEDVWIVFPWEDWWK
jgi:hypoxanthine phosphoribosyltransferase